MATVSIRYARALADVVLKNREQVAVLGELEQFGVWLKESKDLFNVITNPSVSAAEKKRLIQALAKRGAFHRTTENFLKILADHHRFTVYGEVLGAFRRELDRRLGIESVEVTTAAPLSEDDQRALRERLKAFTGGEVRLEYHTDPQLIGGMVAKIGSTVYDGSLREQLNRLRTVLSGE